MGHLEIGRAIDGPRPRDTGVQSVDRAISILELLAQSGPMGVTDIATAVGIHKSTVFRLLSTLESRGLVEQDAERGKYRVGSTMVDLAAGAGRVRDLAAIAHPLCQELAALVGETVNLSVSDGSGVVTIDQALSGDATVTTVNWVGSRHPFHVTAPGKLFLAELGSRELEETIERGLERHTDATITDAAELRSALDIVRQVGYATTYEEHEVGLVAVAMPVRDMGNAVVATVTISGPRYRVNVDSIPKLLSPLQETTARISWRLGHIKRG